MKFLAILISFLVPPFLSPAENGYDLWLRYTPLPEAIQKNYRQLFNAPISCMRNTATLQIARDELKMAMKGMTGHDISFTNNIKSGNLILATPNELDFLGKYFLPAEFAKLGKEGFIIRSIQLPERKILVVTANTDIGILYGSFHLLRLIQTAQSISSINISEIPQLDLRMLNHWDNLNRYVERGYAGISIWNWHQLPDYIDKRYVDYARANASIGINGTVLTNVNANAVAISKPYLLKLKALADLFRPYGIKVYLTARFSAPIEIGKLKTADPLDKEVNQWWQDKAKEIYELVPDFGGFLVKANSEGQPGPQNYGRNHADGANTLADAVKPYGGVIIWRAFVYSTEVTTDRVKQAYDEFKPLDGQFRENVLIQVKNGPLDFQPREPFHPLFGSMQKTQLMMEFQLTQEYLGFATHLVYLPLLQKEVLDANTFMENANNSVASTISSKVNPGAITGMAGVANIGNEVNWCGHDFGQANWYAFGRLAWNLQLDPATIANEWIKMTFSKEPKAVKTISKIMMQSREAIVNYMTPLGLAHIMGNGHHYGPAPWSNSFARAEWNPVYYHRADSLGVGFDRTSTGSDAISQYSPQAAAQWIDSATCDERYLLWFHRVSWNHKMKSGNTLWTELCIKYQLGVDQVKQMQQEWNEVAAYIDKERFEKIRKLLGVQLKEAEWWRDACLSYFQTIAKQELPASVEKPKFTLEYYKSLQFPYAPGNGN